MTETLQHVVDADSAVDRYLAALNEPDPARRAQLIAEAWSPDGGITDPPLAGQGHAGVGQLGDALHALYTGHAFRRTSDVDSHHGHYRFAWALIGPDGAVTMTGLDTGELAADGRVGQVVGFFGELALRS